MNLKLLFFGSLMAFSISLSAQLQRMTGARALGMNNASTALGGDVWALFSNPANIGQLTSTEIGSYFERRYNMEELQYFAFSAVHPFHYQHVVGISVSSFGWEYYRTNMVGLGYSYHLLNLIHLGIRLNYANTSIPVYGNFGTFIVDIGGNAKLSEKINIAFKFQNVNQAEILNDQLPSQMAIGVHYKASKKVKLLSELEKSNLFPFDFKIGLEYQPTEYFFARFGSGIASNKLPAPDNYFMTTSFGAGFYWHHIAFDLGVQWHDRLGISPGISLGYRFKEKLQKSVTPKSEL